MKLIKRGLTLLLPPLSKEIKYKKDSATELAYPWHYVLQKAKYSRLTYDSVVQCEDLRCVSKSRMGKFIMKIDPEDLSEIKKRLKRTLQL